MRIKDKGLFAIGVINILPAVIGSILLIAQRRFGRLPMLGLCLVIGITSILRSIETKKQRQKRKAELLEKAKLYGWYKED